MRYLVISLLFVSIWVDSAAQVNQRIVYTPSSFSQPVVQGFRAFVGSFDFEQLPEPLKPTKVHFTLTATRDSIPRLPNQDWVLKLHFTDAVQVLSDSVFIWPQPHRIGDEFTNTIEFVPLTSNYNEMTVYLAMGEGTFTLPRIWDQGISFAWCFDDDGTLQYLDNRSSKGFCESETMVFFDKDSIIIPQLNELAWYELFKYSITVKPIPRIGDTATAHFRMIPVREIPSKYKLELRARCFEVVSYPEETELNFIEGEELDLAIKFIPKSVRKGHNFGICFRYEHSQVMPFDLVFHEDSTLKYVCISGIDLLPQEMFPTNFRTFNSAADHTEIILKKKNE